MDLFINVKRPAWVEAFHAFIPRSGHCHRRRFHGHRRPLGRGPDQPHHQPDDWRHRFLQLFVVLSGDRLPSLEATRNARRAVVALGLFINAIIELLIVAMAVFGLLRVLTRQDEQSRRAPCTNRFDVRTSAG